MQIEGGPRQRVEQMWVWASRYKQHDNGDHCSRVLVLQEGDGSFLWYWDSGGLFEAGGDCRLVQGEVGYRGEQPPASW